KVFCRGFSMIYNHRYRCWKSSGHGWVDMADAIKYSCNVYFHHLAQRLDVDTIAAYSRRFGFGSPTGVDLAGEKAGLVPDRAWSERARGSRWYPGETISVAIGQGPLLATPLQMAVMIAAVGNGGRLVVPHLLLDGEIRTERHLELSEPTLARLRRALWSTVNDEGTGRSAQVEGFEIAGKTGTSQVVRQETWTDNEDLAADRRDHAWFIAYGPVEAPRLAVVVFVEHGGGGSTVAAPLAKSIYEKFLQTDLAHHGAG
ncbi:MAG: hypothetical protein MI919_14840, partial [Holophagales bacterium]|nr:hypothetical protein [Holophagales bacterium]